MLIPGVEVLEHTADLKIRVHAKTKVGLFVHALLGMFEVIETEWAEGPEVRREVQVESVDQNALLVDFLSEALQLSDTNNEGYKKAEILELTPTKIRATLVGKPIKRLGIEIKAVTYHGLNIREENGEYNADILFDI